MLEALFVFILLTLIFIVSQNSIRTVSRLLFVLFKTSSRVVKWLAFLLLPGTFIHEVGHLIFAEVLMVRTHDLNVIPQIKEDNSVRLGGVQIEKTDPVRRTIIGLAPVLFGLIIIWVATYYLTVLTDSFVYQVIYVYILFQIMHTMFSSRKDLEGAIIGFIFIFLLALLVKYLAGIVVFAPITLVKARVGDFLSINLVYLKNGLFYGLGLLVLFNLLLYLLLKLVKRR